MSLTITMPKLGVEMETAVLSEWIAADGAHVAEGEVIANLETDKVVFELTASESGILHRIADEGAEYAIGDILGRLSGASDSTEDLATASGGADLPAGGSENGGAPVETSTAAARTRDAAAATIAQTRTPASGHGVLASPLARRVAEAHALELSSVTGTGPRGAIRRADVERAIAAGPTQPSRDRIPPETDGAASLPSGTAHVTQRLSPIRRTIAQRMHHSLQSTAQMTDIREHDVTALVALRDRAVAGAERLGFRLSYSALFARAALLALRAVPELNAHAIGENEIHQFDRVELGTAVAIEGGLLVPVVHAADQLSLRELNEQLAAVIERARSRAATADELSGGTFTITNFGSYGSHIGTPILLPPQVGILGIGAMIERPVVRDGQIAIGKVMYTSLTVDHRIVDGETAGRFQNELAQLFALPDLLLIG